MNALFMVTMIIEGAFALRHHSGAAQLLCRALTGRDPGTKHGKGGEDEI